MAPRKTTTSTTKKTATKTADASTSTTLTEESNGKVLVDAKEYEEMRTTNEVLQNQVELVLKKIQELEEKSIARSESIESDNEYSDEYVDINPLKPIKVISLSTGGVTLRTSPDGKGNVARFTKFGQPRFVTYQDLQNMITVDRSFIEEGMVYICDKDVVKNNYLEESYSKFLTKETIENILSFDVDKLEEMISSTTEAIQDTIISFVVEKINKNEYVDMNKVTVIGSSCTKPCDIMQLAMRKRETKTSKK